MPGQHGRAQRDRAGVEHQVRVGVGADGQRVVERLARRREAEQQRVPPGLAAAQPGPAGPDPVLLEVAPGQHLPVVPDRLPAGQHVGLAEAEADPGPDGVPQRRRQLGLPAVGDGEQVEERVLLEAAGRPSPPPSAGPRRGPGDARPGRGLARRPSGRRCRPSGRSRPAGWRPGPAAPGRRATGRARPGRTRPWSRAARRGGPPPWGPWVRPDRRLARGWPGQPGR